MAPLDNHGEVSRRVFLKTGVTTAAAASLPLDAFGKEQPAAPPSPLPRRVLGRTGEKVTILNMGSAQGAANARMFNANYTEGVRYIDTADCYEDGKAEKAVGEWLAKTGRRKEFFIVTKDHPETPDEWVKMIDKRLEALQTDTVDLFFIHELGKGFRGGGDESQRDWPKMKEWGAAADKMKKAGKIRFAGFSSHTAVDLRTAMLNNAAAGGWVDAIMVAYDPMLVRENAEFNKALDACHKAGVGLICMKEMRAVADAPKFLPQFKEMGLTTHQAVLHSVWTDERFASICSAMPNVRILAENSEAARNFKPMGAEKVGAVLGVYKKYASAFCNGCDGSCQRAGGTKAALGDIARTLSYYERDGMRGEARRLYAALSPEERNWAGADLAAASAACVSNLDFASLLSRAEEKLS